MTAPLEMVALATSSIYRIIYQVYITNIDKICGNVGQIFNSRCKLIGWKVKEGAEKTIIKNIEQPPINAVMWIKMRICFYLFIVCFCSYLVHEFCDGPLSCVCFIVTILV